MPDAFDPYHKWLAIPPEDQPPDHYRLLGVKRFEGDPDVIANAADQRMVHVRSFQAGDQSAASQKLLNEIAAARVCLLNPKKRAAYDERLRAEEAPEEPAAAFPELVTAAGATQAPHVRPGRTGRKPFYQQTPWQVAMAAVAAGLVIGVVLVLANRSRQPDGVAREDAPAPQPDSAPRDRGARKPLVSAGPEKGKRAEAGAPGKGAGDAKPQAATLQPKPGAAPEKPATPKPKPETPKPKPETPPQPIAPAVPKKAPLPDAEALQKAEQMFQEVFGEQVAGAKPPAQKAALAEKILAQVAGTDERSAEVLVMLRHATELAAEAGRCDRMLEVIDQQARRFDVDPLKAKTDALARAVDAPKDAQPEVVRSCLALLDEALAAEDMETAGRLADAALASARKARNAEVLKTAVARRKEVEALAGAYEAARAARKTLAQRPDDPAANATWGKYLAAMQHDWAAGLVHLAKTDDAALARAAADDLAAPSDPASQAAIGDAWHKLGQSGGGPMKEPCLARAAWWYEKAMFNLEGLEQVRVEKRLASIKVSEAHRIPPDIGIADPDAVPVGEVRSFGIPGPVCDIAVSRDGRTAMASGWGHQVAFWDVPSGKELARLKYTQVIYGVAISPDGRFAVCGGREPVLHFIDFKTKREIKSPPVGHWQFKPVFLKDGKHCVIGTMSGAWLWDVEAGKEGRKFGATQGWVQDLVISRDGRFLLTGSPDHTARVFDMATGSESVRMSVEGADSYIRVVTISPDGSKALAGADHKIVHVWDLKTQREILRLKHEGAIYGLDVSESGRYVLTGDGAHVRLWNLATGEELWKWPAPRVGPMTFLPDNRFALVGAGAVHLIRLPIDKRGRIFEGPTERRTREPAGGAKPETP